MPRWLPALAYPPPQRGWWDPITATLNWCEEDYYATIYLAEVTNALTNLLFLSLAAKGVANCLQHGHDAVFLLAFLGYGCVGLGSFAFHSTLKYPMQLWDELSMIYTTCLMCYATFAWSRSVPFRVGLGISLVALAAFITMYYVHLQDPTFHQNAYAILTAIVVVRAIYVMEARLRPSLKRTSTRVPRTLEGRDNDKGICLARASKCNETAVLSRMWLMILVGLTIFLSGFAIWQVDNVYCNDLRRIRRSLGLPWGILFEGHAWWHVMTGTGAYFYIVWGIWLRHCLNGREREYHLQWPSMWSSLPEVVRTHVDDDRASPKAKDG